MVVLEGGIGGPLGVAEQLAVIGSGLGLALQFVYHGAHARAF
jgi:hypothetical protein